MSGDNHLKMLLFLVTFTINHKTKLYRTEFLEQFDRNSRCADYIYIEEVSRWTEAQKLRASKGFV